MRRLNKERIGICLIIIAIALLAALAGSSPVSAAPGEYEIKAAFLYNFANFVQWPDRVAADSGGTFVIGVCGDDPFGSALEQAVAGKTVDGHRIEIKRFSSVRDLRPCHILFVSASEEGHTGRILDAVKDWHALTVGETDGFARNGGAVGFFMESKRVRFEINGESARNAGLKVSSRLMKLARVVKA